MKKAVSFLIMFAFVLSITVPAYAKTKSETVTVSLDKIEDLLINPTSEELLNAQLLYLTCCNDALKTATNANTYDSKAQELAIAEKKLELGYISQKEYEDIAKSLKDTSTSQVTDTNTRAQNLLSLRHMFGLDDDDKMIVKAADYSKINLNKINNASYKRDLKDNDLNDLSGSDATDTELTGKVEALKRSYDALYQASLTYQTSLTDYQKKEADAKLTQSKYQQGYATKQEVDDINRELSTMKITVDINRNNLYAAYLKYDFLRNNPDEYQSFH
ncbi:hypothetical protein FL966_12470 [Caproiciproducens galactitolivorans]|uniref:Outer membrane efflux protein n=1 Tax=Caproiciproducens galactitolivorans TaxID=642589 RepID=A0A4Z0YAD7_9FIRM|nr:hypothetical protein [Caproiciproducens galactitolivorans]QEY35804.1 hypothetical protein FL966_12470 [Caproiciproducens galactitolivorans]TGJ75773.1 hypothetical protein CAGA_21510 [Caproiciproducens galactitolivorans]